MKLKYLAIALILVFSANAFAQEGEMQVIDEVIAQVNDEVITLSMLKRETQARIEALKQRRLRRPIELRTAHGGRWHRYVRPRFRAQPRVE